MYEVVERPKPAADLRPRVLLIDDHPEGLRELTALLSQRCRLSIAADGQRGYQRARHLPPDLILLDVAMPHADGFATCRLLKGDPQTRDIPVIFLSAHAGAQQRLQGLALGAVDYVGKPCLPEEVLLRMQVHLRPRLPATLPLAPADASDADADGPPDDALLQAATVYIREHLESLPDHAGIAQALGTYEKRLARLFRERLGSTISAFVAEERMQAGQRLLAVTALPVQEVAVQVGFRNAGNFSTAFKERFGFSPLTFRRQRQ